MSKSVERVFLGILILFLSYALFKITDSVIGWSILFVPGAAFILYGLFGIFFYNDF
jgi:hypothetical protein